METANIRSKNINQIAAISMQVLCKLISDPKQPAHVTPPASQNIRVDVLRPRP